MGPLVGAAIGIGSGLIEEGGKLLFGQYAQDMQLAGQRQALRQQNAASLDLWNKTNYGAQMKHLKDAGLNPGLIYGMGGSGGHLGSSSAMPDQVKSTGMGIADKAQLALLDAQRRNIDADTEKKKIDAAKTAGVDTEAVKAGISKTRLDTDLAQLEKNFINKTFDERVWGYTADMRKKEEELIIAQNNRVISDETFNTQIDLLKAQYSSELIKQEAMRAGIAVDEQKVKNMVMDIIYEGRKVRVAENGQLTNAGRLELDQYTRDIPDSWKEGMRIVGDILGKVLSPKIGLGKGKQKWSETEDGKKFKNYWDSWK